MGACLSVAPGRLDHSRSRGYSQMGGEYSYDDLEHNPEGPLTREEILSRQESSGKDIEFICGEGQPMVAFMTQRGYYPDDEDKSNQDAYSCHTSFGNRPGNAFFAVYDGHGKDGHLVAQFTKKQLPKLILAELEHKVNLRDGSNPVVRGLVQVSRGLSEGLITAVKRLSSNTIPTGSAANSSDNLAAKDEPPPIIFTSEEVTDALRIAHLKCNERLRGNSNIGSDLAGTTSISCFIHEGKLYVSNLGDSRAILISKDNTGSVDLSVVFPLSKDQTPYRRDERERVKKYGARVLSMDQLEGLEPVHDNWEDLELGQDLDVGGDPPRLWHPTLKVPGTAFTRSIGDFFAETIGVVADPEILVHEIDTENDQYLVLCSDGIFEFMTNRMVADVVLDKKSPMKACRELVRLAYEKWLEEEVRTDDITAVVIKFDETVVKNSVLTSAEAEVMLSMPTRITAMKSSEKLSSSAKEGSVVDQEDIIFSDTNSVVGVPLEEETPTWVDVSSGRKKRTRRSLIIHHALHDEDKEIATVLDISSHVVKKSDADIAIIKSAISNNFLFRNSSEDGINAVIDVMHPMDVKKGQVLIKQGDAGSAQDHFYVVHHGRFDVQVDSNVIHTYEGLETAKSHPGFGELSLLYDKPRAASVIAKTDGRVFCLNRVIFKQVVTRTHDFVQGILKCLRLIPALVCLDVSQLQKLALAFHHSEEHCKAGDMVLIQNKTEDDKLYMILRGRMRVGVDDGGSARMSQNKARMIAYKNDDVITPGNCFGVTSFEAENGQKVSYSVVAMEDSIILSCSRFTFEGLFGESLVSMRAAYKKRKDKLRRPSAIAPPSFSQVTFTGYVSSTDVARLRVGTFAMKAGASGTLNRYETTNVSVHSFVLSEVDLLMRRNSVSTLLDASRMISGLAMHNPASQYIPKLMSVYHAKNALHLLYDRALIGDLSHLMRCGASPVERLEVTKNLDMRQCVKYAAAAVAQGLWAIHDAGIIFRNVTMESVMLTSDGRISLNDFALCKIVGNSCKDSKTYTICGSTNYLAPEQLAQEGHDETVDFWGLGVFLFEFLTGDFPLMGKNEIATYTAITAYSEDPSSYKLRYQPDDEVQTEAKEIISRLLTKKGSRMTTKQEFEAHPFFSQVDWKDTAVESPFRALAHKELIAMVNEDLGDSQELLDLFDLPQDMDSHQWASSLASSI